VSRWLTSGRRALRGWRSVSTLPRRLSPLVLVWTTSKLLVLESRLVKSEKLNLLELEPDRRLPASSCPNPLSTLLPAESGFR
jgi:hypothetical protein